VDARRNIEIEQFAVNRTGHDGCRVTAMLVENGRTTAVEASGNGPIDAFVRGINQSYGTEIHCVDYAEHALGEGEDAEAMAYVRLRANEREAWGVGRMHDIVAASLNAVASAVGRLNATVCRTPT
jgi:2-isopropylmalate synthase